MNEKKFGGSGITKELFDWIINNISEGSTIVELGAGKVSTNFLSKKYKLFSIENDVRFINLYNSTYIYAPIDESINWYNVKEIKENLPDDYHCILVDGPAGEGNRFGFVENIHLFKQNIPIIIDDTWRKGEKNLLLQVSDKLKRSFISFDNFSVVI